MKNAGRQTLSPFRLAAGPALIGLLAWSGLAPAPAAAQGSPQQQAACSGDAQRLCGQFIPDVAKITACMSHKRSQVSAACAATITPPSHGHSTHHHHS
jgi:hypothetical protein